MAVAWHLNFDADDELARPESYAPSSAALARRDDLAVASRLVSPDDIVVDSSCRLADPLPGRAFCPTPRALAALAAAGASPPLAPTLDVLRRVNHRAFCAELGRELPGGRLVHSLDQIRDALHAGEPSASWVLKRPFGFAGRGMRRVRVGEVCGAARTWIEASLRTGEPLVLEPWLERCGDFGLHGHVSLEAGVVLGEPTIVDVDANGAWRQTRRAGSSDLAADERRLLHDTAMETAEALVRAGYFGPFGIDAFRWRAHLGRTQLNPRCEINARYSMGWVAGMGDRRPDLP